MHPIFIVKLYLNLSYLTVWLVLGFLFPSVRFEYLLFNMLVDVISSCTDHFHKLLSTFGIVDIIRRFLQNPSIGAILKK